MAKKRVYGYDKYQQKIKEGIYEPGFIKEFEDEIEGKVSKENESDIDNLGEGEKLTDNDDIVDVDLSDDTDTNSNNTEQSIDMGNREDISDDEVKVKMEFINDQLKSFNNLLKKSDQVALDKTTKEKIIKVYNTLQGVV